MVVCVSVVVERALRADAVDVDKREGLGIGVILVTDIVENVEVNGEIKLGVVVQNIAADFGDVGQFVVLPDGIVGVGECDLVFSP